MSRTTLRFLGILFIALCSMMPALYGEKPLSESAAAQSIVPEDSESMASGRPGVDSAVQTAQQEIRDPFGVPVTAPVNVPVVSADIPQIKAELQGIGFGSKDAYAVIGGDIFYIGEEKRGMKLLEVRRHEVDILINGGKVKLLLFPGDELAKSKERKRKKKTETVPPVDQPEENSLSFPGREQPLS